MAILSISSEYGTGALRIGHAIEAQLGYEYIPLRRLLAEAGQSGKKWKRLAAKYTVDPSDIWEANDFVAFMALVQSIILGHALRDNVVILARGSNFLLKDVPHALRVRFTAPLEERIAMVVGKEGVNRETARLLVKQADREIDCSMHLAYGPDWDDAEVHEIRFDTGAQSPGEIVEIVRELLRAKEALKTPGALESLRRQFVGSRIKAAVLAHPEVILSSLEVTCVGDAVRLAGVVRSRAALRKIEQEVRAIAGTVPLRFELGCPTIKPRPVVSKS
jgi:cytidylate kinase